MGDYYWKHDPGPCPVDDTPHTACTPESVALRSHVPQSLQVALTPPRVFSTAQYRRALHHPDARVRESFAPVAVRAKLPEPAPVKVPPPPPPRSLSADDDDEERPSPRVYRARGRTR